MARELPLPPQFRASLGLPHGHDYHMVDIKLKDGRKFFGIPVAHENVIVGIKSSGTAIDLNFASEDIAEVRRARFNLKSIFGLW
jgi:hypothetical protein